MLVLVKMAILELYHGSTLVLPKPYKGGGNPHNDYGPGFYCTRNLALAYEWSCDARHIGFANKYELETDGLTILNLNGPGVHILNWLAVLLENRVFDVPAGLPEASHAFILDRFLPDYKDFDVLTGYRADDSYFSFARAFLDGSISLEQLSRAMRLGKLGEQVVIRSEKAYEALTFVTCAPTEHGRYFPQKMARDRKARETYQAILKESRKEDEVYMIDILRQGWSNDDERLR